MPARLQVLEEVDNGQHRREERLSILVGDVEHFDNFVRLLLQGRWYPRCSSPFPERLGDVFPPVSRGSWLGLKFWEHKVLESD